MAYRSATVHGKFGELLQGALPGRDKHFSISLPISHYVQAICWRVKNDCRLNDAIKSSKSKSMTLLAKLVEHSGENNLYDFRIINELPTGKGLGSSTADMVAVARAYCKVANITLSNADLCSLLREIEPTDSLMYNHRLVCFNHKLAHIYTDFNWLPSFSIVGVDEGGQVDTLAFNQSSKPYSEQEKTKFGLLLDSLSQAINDRDVDSIGHVATESSLINQAINPKRYLALMLDICNSVGGKGVIVAHSGTYIGIILDNTQSDYGLKKMMAINLLNKNKLDPELFNTAIDQHSLETLNIA